MTIWNIAHTPTSTSNTTPSLKTQNVNVGDTIVLTLSDADLRGCNWTITSGVSCSYTPSTNVEPSAVTVTGFTVGVTYTLNYRVGNIGTPPLYYGRLSGTVAAADTTPDNYTVLAGTLQGALLNTTYYAAFTSAVPTTTAAAAFVPSGVTGSITATATNGQVSIDGTNWGTSQTVALGGNVFFRITTPNAYTTTTTHSLQLGTVTQSFTSSTVSTITNINGFAGTGGGQIGYMLSTATSYTVDHTGFAALRYRIRSGAGAEISAPALGAQTGRVITTIPAVGGTANLFLQGEYVLNSGAWVDQTALCQITRVLLPVVGTQTFNTTTFAQNITHVITFTAGSGGTTNYGTSTTNSYAAVTNWSATNSFTVARGTAYYFWVRQAPSATYAAVGGPQTVPYMSGDSVVDVSGAVIGTSLSQADTANYSLSIAGTSVGTTYRALENGIFAASVAGNGGTAIMTLVFANGALPAAGTTSTYVIQAGVETADGGNANYVQTTGTNNTFTISRIGPDQNPQGFLNLAGNVTGATLNGNYYATFSTAAAGTTAPGTGYLLNDIDTAITVTPNANSAYSTNGTTWLTTGGSVAVNATVYFRATAAATIGVIRTHTLTMGTAPSRSFTTSTYSAATAAIGVVSRTPTGDLTSTYASSITINFTAAVAGQKYKVTRTSGTVTDLIVGSVVATSGASSLVFTESPPAGSTYTYQIYTLRDALNGGDDQWYPATGTGIGTAFTITKILTPQVNDTQTWDTSTNTSTISHSIQLKVAGTGGSPEFAISNSATYNTSLIGTWQNSAAFTLTRGSSYYLWARRSTASADADGSTLQTVPAYANLPPYGLRVYGTDGTTILLDISSRIPRALVKGGPISVNAFTTSSAISVPGLTSSDYGHVAVLTPDSSTPNPTVVNINYSTQSFTITNNTASTVTDYYYYVFNSGEVV